MDTAPTNFLHSHLGLDRFYSLGPILPNYGSYFADASLTVNDTPIPKLLEHRIVTKLDPNVNPVVFTGTTQVNATGPTPGQELLAHLAAYSALSVKYIVTAASTALPTEADGIRLTRVFVDPTVAIYQLSVVAPFFSSSNRACRLTPVDVTRVDLSCSGPATVVRRELFMPGWTATDNGRPVAVHQVDGVFEAVTVGAGHHTLVFTFTPPYETLALIAFVLGVLAVLGSVASGVTARRRHDVDRGPEGEHRRDANFGVPPAAPE